MMRESLELWAASCFFGMLVPTLWYSWWRLVCWWLYGRPRAWIPDDEYFCPRCEDNGES